MNTIQAYREMRYEMLRTLSQPFATFPLDNVSDAFEWVNSFEGTVNGQFGRVEDLKAAVRDGEYGQEHKKELIEKLDCFFSALDEFAEESISEAQDTVSEMISTGMADYEDEDEDVEEKQELMEELESLLNELQDSFDDLESATKNSNIEQICQ